MNPETHIAAGLPKVEVLRRCQASLNQADVLPEDLLKLQAEVDEVCALLHDPVTADEARALNDYSDGCRYPEDVIAWLEGEPISWDGYFVRKAAADRELAEYLKQQDEDWALGVGDFASDLSPDEKAERDAQEIMEAKAYYKRYAQSCPRCGTPPESLDWYHRPTPPSSWRRVYAGWKTSCRRCKRSVDTFTGVSGRGRRPEIPSKNPP